MCKAGGASTPERVEPGCVKLHTSPYGRSPAGYSAGAPALILHVCASAALRDAHLPSAHEEDRYYLPPNATAPVLFQKAGSKVQR